MFWQLEVGARIILPKLPCKFITLAVQFSVRLNSRSQLCALDNTPGKPSITKPNFVRLHFNLEFNKFSTFGHKDLEIQTGQVKRTIKTERTTTERNYFPEALRFRGKKPSGRSQLQIGN